MIFLDPVQTRNHHNQGFMTEEAIETIFATSNRPGQPQSKEKNNFENWYKANADHKMMYGHHEKIGEGNYYDCDNITDEWFKWFLTNPVSYNPFTNRAISGSSMDSSSFGSRDLFLFNRNKTAVYFTTASPFQRPDFRTITMTKKAPLLIPVYNMSASLVDFPSVKSEEELVNIVKNDLSRLKQETVEASFDGQSIHGCCVIRNKPLPIKIPKENIIGIPEDRLQETDFTIEIYHGGFWLLIREDEFSPGDHLLYFKAESVNYEMEAKILINALI